MTDTNHCRVTNETPNGTLVIAILTTELRTPEVVYALRDEMIELAGRGNINKIVLDLERVGFIGSAGFLAFLSLSRVINERPGGQILLCNMPPNIEQVFALCRLISKDEGQTAPFRAVPTREAAIAHLSSK